MALKKLLQALGIDDEDDTGMNDEAGMDDALDRARDTGGRDVFGVLGAEKSDEEGMQDALTRARGGGGRDVFGVLDQSPPPRAKPSFAVEPGPIEFLTNRDAAEPGDSNAKDPLMVAPPPPAFESLFQSPGKDGGPQHASSPEASQMMAEASRNIERMDRLKNKGQMTPDQEAAFDRDYESAYPSGGELAGAGRGLRSAADVMQSTKKPAPVRSGASVAQKEQLADAFRRAGVDPNPESSATEQLAARAQREDMPDDSGGGASPDQKSQLADAFRRGSVNPEQQQAAAQRGGGESGGPLGAVSKMVMGSSDPRMAGLEKALKERNRLLRQADFERNMGSATDIMAGTNYNANAGAGSKARGEALVEGETEKLKLGRELGDFDSRQADSAQRRQLNLSKEGRDEGDFDSRQADSAQRRKLQLTDEDRAVAGEGRAVAEEGRKQQAFDVKAGSSDPSSAVSRNARAQAESVHGPQWNRIPKEVRDTFTADDVDRLFKEVDTPRVVRGGGAGSTAKTSSTMRLLMSKEPEAFHTERQARNIERVVDDLGGWDQAMVGIVKGAAPNVAVSAKDQELRQRVSEMIAGYINSRYGAALSEGERKMAEETVANIKAGEPATRVRQTIQLIRERSGDRLNQVMAGQPPEIIDSVRDAFDNPDKYDVFSGGRGGGSQSGAGKIRVTNGKRQFMIDPADLADAVKEGFRQVQ